MASIRVDEQTGEIYSGGLRGLLRAIASQVLPSYHFIPFLNVTFYVIFLSRRTARTSTRRC
jgi:hypothetical protein